MHVSDAHLELYAMNALAEMDMQRVEEHLLVCAECRERLNSTDEYVDAMRAATKEAREEESRPTKRRA
jgi:hypothetical protein